MTPLTNLRPAVRRWVVAALSSAVLLGSAAAAGTTPLAGTEDARATPVAQKKVKAKASGRKIT